MRRSGEVALPGRSVFEARLLSVSVIVLSLASCAPLPAAAEQPSPSPVRLALTIVHGSRDRSDWRAWQRQDPAVQARIRALLAQKKRGEYDASRNRHDVGVETTSEGASVAVLLDNEDAVELAPLLRAVTIERDRAGSGVIALRLAPEAADRMRAFSRAHRGEVAAIVLGDEIVSAPRVLGSLEDRLWIVGDFSRDELERIAGRLRRAITDAGAPDGANSDESSARSTPR
ncbi:MAG: hypothetical protein D6776_07855 [Planctomycetota bacterium]|nr:MAG: hypothetical protein D6776_07855 [Planctomycetota bacterium]